MLFSKFKLSIDCPREFNLIESDSRDENIIIIRDIMFMKRKINQEVLIS